MYEILSQRDPEEFVFTTKAGIIYSCLFVSATEEFGDYPDVAPIIYFFYLNAITGNPRLQGPDEAIGETIAVIIENFMLQNSAAIIYFCDPLNNQELQRQRKFEHWFHKFCTAKITRFDSKVQAGNTYLLHTLLVANAHPMIDRIISVFLQLTKHADDKPADQ